MCAPENLLAVALGDEPEGVGILRGTDLHATKRVAGVVGFAAEQPGGGDGDETDVEVRFVVTWREKSGDLLLVEDQLIEWGNIELAQVEHIAPELADEHIVVRRELAR